MPSDAKIQVNWGPNSPIPLVNIYANSIEEEELLTAHVQNRMSTWVATGHDFRTVGVVADAGVLAPGAQQPPAVFGNGAGTATVPAPPTQSWGQVPAPAAPAPAPAFAQAAAPMCNHGPRTPVSKMGKDGQPYKGWMCGAPQGAVDKCKNTYLPQPGQRGHDPAQWAAFPA